MATQAIDLKPVETKLSILKARADAIEVRDAESYAEACQIAVAARAEVKNIGFVLDPGIQSAKAHLDELRNQKAVYVGRVTPIIDAATQKAEAWKAEERRKAQIEQDRINAERREQARIKAEEERKAAEAQAAIERKERERQAEEARKAQEKEIERQRKAGEIGKREAERLKKAEAEEAERTKREAAENEARQKALAEQQARETAANVQQATVKPAVPTVAGIKARVNYKFEVINPMQVNRAYLMPDEVAIGAKVRKDKDPEKSMAEIGGIRAWTEDSV